jgi:hypothetical protein
VDLQLEHLITMTHLENMNKVILATGMIVGYAYGTEFFIAWYSGNPYTSYVFFVNRAFGPYWWAYWSMITCNVISPQFFWFKKLRTNIPFMFHLDLRQHRHVVRAVRDHRHQLHRDFLPSSWGYFRRPLLTSSLSSVPSGCS